MPMPTPNDGESHDDWIDRCMSNPTMKDEFAEEDQRLATCNTIWDDSRSKAPVESEAKAAMKPERLALANKMAEVRVQTMANREDGSEAPHEIRGYAAVFYDGTSETEFRLYEDLVERIMPGAFDDVLASKPDVRALFNHDPTHLLGRTSAGTMSLSVDSKGLAYRIVLGDTNIAQDVAKHVQRGDINGSSFAFGVKGQEFRREDGIDIRELTQVNPLLDCGPVTYPAYAGTAAGFRATDDIAREVRAAVANTGEPESPPAKPTPPPTSPTSEKWRQGWRPKSSEDAKTRRLREWAENLT